MHRVLVHGALWGALCVMCGLLITPVARAEEPPALAMAIDDGVPDGEKAAPGDRLHYTLTYSNTGSSPISNIQLSAVVPGYTHVISETTQDWSCQDRTDAPSLCILDNGTLPAYAQQVVEFTVVLDDPLPETLLAVTLDASVTGDEVVCGECGLASIDTPVDPTAGLNEGSFQLYFPAISYPQPTATRQVENGA